MRFAYAQYKQKGFAPILIVLVIAVAAAVGGYFLYTNYSKNQTKTESRIESSPTTSGSGSIGSENIAGWQTYKTYKNEIYQFSYPKEWSLKEYEEGLSQTFHVNDDTIMIARAFKGKSILNGITFDDPVGTKKELIKGKIITKTENLTIDGYKAFKTISEVQPGTDPAVKPAVDMYIDTPQYLIRLNMDTDKNPELSNKIFNLIISTLKFTQ